MSRVRTILAGLPDADDVLRRLADVIQVPSGCRRRGCRTQGLCQGGFGPPCFLENRKRFSDAVLEEMAEHRQHWIDQRARIETLLRR
ncbi:hypothetical protein JKG68_15165 [Microvirga aerilata]|uniref:Uncharacterized protein n=1 Tax=Microvirga aerilata TaxID=670292 RepID=A0A936ZII0_9HYPH|nr:hypothetical protein [Microvirga aerilata]MBL0405309.1 hypothetical protein [Microvirga aerilata]